MNRMPMLAAPAWALPDLPDLPDLPGIDAALRAPVDPRRQALHDDPDVQALTTRIPDLGSQARLAAQGPSGSNANPSH